MLGTIGMICIFILVLLVVIYLAYSVGSKSTKLEVQKAEARERMYANKQMDMVRNMSDDDVRNRLQNRTDN